MRNFFNKYGYVLVIASFLLLLFMQLHNVVQYPFNKSFDSGGHLEYIEYLKSEKRIPLAPEGWELYQPPLYYFLLLVFGADSAIKPLSFIIWILFGLISYKTLQYFHKSPRKNFALVILLYALPVFIYSSLQVGNEFFSAFMISLTLFYYAKNQKSLYKNYKQQLILGLLMGLSILSKATGLVLVFSIFFHMILTDKTVFKIKINTVMRIVGILIFVGGWYYIRNWILLGNAFATSVDYEWFVIHQLPGYRDIKFFTTFSGFFNLDLYLSHWYSLWSGLYYSWFYDAHNSVLPIVSFSKIGVLTVIYSIPLFVLSLKGLFRLFKKPRLSIFPIYSAFLMFSLILYNIKLPYYSTVKSMFLLSLVIPYLLGISTEIHRAKIKNTYLYLYVFFLSVFIFKQFWVNPSWYSHLISYL